MRLSFHVASFVVRSCSRRLLYKLVSEYDATNAPKKHWNVVHFRRAAQPKFFVSKVTQTFFHLYLPRFLYSFYLVLVIRVVQVKYYMYLNKTSLIKSALNKKCREIRSLGKNVIVALFYLLIFL